MTTVTDGMTRWCHQSQFHKYANPDHACDVCNGDVTRPMEPAKEHCTMCRLPCGDDCGYGVGPCCGGCWFLESVY